MDGDGVLYYWCRLLCYIMILPIMLYTPSSNRNSKRCYSKRSLTLVEVALLATLFSATSTSWFASAQNVNAGKFASRAKLDEGTMKKKKKKRNLFGREERYFSATDGEFGTSNFWTRWIWRKERPPRRSSAANDYYSSWELVLAESKMIFISLITSVICVVLSWIWYSVSDGGGDKKENAMAEDGAEDLVCDTPEQLHSGFLQSVEVGFEDVGMVLKQKKGRPDRVILDGSIRGAARPGRMLAIMGPSGSGKSTLLHAIAGNVKDDKKISLYGKRYINNESLTGDSRIPAAFIEQEAKFFPHMTVKETLDFQVELKMGSFLKKRAERDALVQDLMIQLGLSKSANTIVGNAKVRGISGGERKRLSIACEMISSPSVIFLDEPTSGLDSYQATQVIETLRGLADQGKTIVSVIHQPSQHTFQLFDDLLLLSEGRLMYFGEVSKVRQYMADLGYGCESEIGTAEHVLDCVSRVVGADDEAERLSIERIERIASYAVHHAHQSVSFSGDDSVKNKSFKKMKHIIDKTAAHPGTNIFRQFRLLLERSVQELLRGKAAIFVKIVQQVSLGVIYGGIYSLGDDQASIMDRFGLLSLIIIGATNMAMAGTVRSFPKEKAIVTGEIASRMYRTGPYFIAKAISEIPLIGLCNVIFGAILYPLVNLQKGKLKNFLGLTSLHSLASEGFGLLIGSVAPNSDVALALFPPIIVLNIIFDGKNIAEENTPKLLRWVNKIGLIRWGFTGLALNEFEGLEFRSSGRFRGPVAKTGQDALARFGMDGKSLDDVVRAQMMIVAGCWVLSFLGLSLTRQKFEVMMTPPE